MVIKLVSASDEGQAGNSDSFAPSISSDGRFVAFQSAADNLVPGDTNRVQDIFVYDFRVNHVARISMAGDGQEANGTSQRAVISADGSTVVFESQATNLDPADLDTGWDIYRVNLEDATISLVSVALEGDMSNGRVQHPALSASGRYVAFAADSDNLVSNDTNNQPDVFIYDHRTGEMSRVSVNSAGEQGNGISMHPALSANGNLVAFQSLSTNFDAGLTGYHFQVFLHDRETGETVLITRGLDGQPGNMESQRPSLSANGQFIAFESWANNLVPGDTNLVSDVFVYDRMQATFSLASLTSQGAQARHMSGSAAISGNGRYVAFASLADNLFPGDENYAYDVFLHDRESGETALVSVNPEGTVGNDASISPAVSAGARRIVFDSMATDLIPLDNNQRADVFILDQLLPLTESLFLPSVYR